MSQSNLDSAARKRILELVRQGATVRGIVAQLAAEGVRTSVGAVSRAITSSGKVPRGRAGGRGRPRKASEAVPTGRRASERRERVAAPVGASASSASSVDAIADFLDEELAALMAEGEGARGTGTLDARGKRARLIAELAERVRQLRPPPPVDPDATDDTVAACKELVDELERLVALAEAEARVA